MTTADTLPRSTATLAPAAGPAPTRIDLYVDIHKALRHFLCDTLLRIGRLDVADADAFDAGLRQLEALLELCLQHLETENAFVHAAIDARQPRGASRTADDHLEHRDTIEALSAEAGALRAAGAAERPALALRLYRHLALFVAENLRHMHVEETVNNALLWQHYDDAALLALHGRILASLPLSEHLAVARWMVPALPPADRAVVVGGMQQGMPAPVFERIVDSFRPHLDDTAWDRLARALKLPQVPGLVDCR